MNDWDPTEALLERLRQLAAARSGFRPDAIAEPLLSRFIKQRLEAGVGRQELSRQVRQQDPRLVEALVQAVVPSPTHLYRHPEQFQFLTAALRVGQVGHGKSTLRAWSAGCSTGEEAYSMAATLLSAQRSMGLGAHAEPTVLGTDLLPGNLAVAEQGKYTGSSMRASTPLLHPVVDTVRPGHFRVRQELLGLTSFAHHNLLDEPLEDMGPFDVVFCRNVFIYMTPAAIRLAWQHIRSVLSPGALVVFGPADLVTDLKQLEPAGSDELNVFYFSGEETSVVMPVGTPRVRGQPQPRGPERLPGAPAVRAKPASKPAVPKAGQGDEPLCAWESQVAEPAGEQPEAEQPPHPGADRPDELHRAPGSNPAPGIVDEHLQALELLERERYEEAERVLARIYERAPAYVPGLIEYALLCRRRQEHELAQHVMETAFERTQHMDPDAMLEGPSLLPVRYYRSVAQTFLWGAELPSVRRP